MVQATPNIWMADVRAVFQRIPGVFSQTFFPWTDDGQANLDDVAAFICDEDAASDEEVTDEMRALNGLLAYFKAESIAQKFDRIMLVAGCKDDLLDALAQRGVLFVADIRKKASDIPVDLFYPREKMRWATNKQTQQEMLVWSYTPYPEQINAIAQGQLKRETFKVYEYLIASLTRALTPLITTEQRQHFSETFDLTHVADEQVNYVWKEMSFGALDAEDCAQLEEARHRIAQTPYDFYMVRLEGRERSNIKTMLESSEANRIMDKFDKILLCWRYACSLFKGNEEVERILEQFDTRATFDEALGMLKEIGRVMGVDLMLDNMYGEDPVPVDYVVDFEHMLRRLNEHYM